VSGGKDALVALSPRTRRGVRDYSLSSLRVQPVRTQIGLKRAEILSEMRSSPAITRWCGDPWGLSHNTVRSQSVLVGGVSAAPPTSRLGLRVGGAALNHRCRVPGGQDNGSRLAGQSRGVVSPEAAQLGGGARCGSRLSMRYAMRWRAWWRETTTPRQGRCRGPSGGDRLKRTATESTRPTSTADDGPAATGGATPDLQSVPSRPVSWSRRTRNRGQIVHRPPVVLLDRPSELGVR